MSRSHGPISADNTGFRLSVRNRAPVEFYGRLGGMVPFPGEILKEIQRMAKGDLRTDVNPRDAWLERMAALA